MTMTRVILVRHGRTTANAGGILAGRSPGVDLDEVGHEQVVRTRGHLADVVWDAVVTSPLDRTRQTAGILVEARPDAPLHVDDRVQECDYGEWTGSSLKALAKDPMWKVVQAHPSAAHFPGGESLLHVQHRAVSALREWNGTLGSDATYVVVSHGDVIKAILADALGLHLDHFQRLCVDPASVSIIDYTPLRPFVERMNDTGQSIPGRTGSKGRKSGGARTRRRASDAAVGGGAGR